MKINHLYRYVLATIFVLSSWGGVCAQNKNTEADIDAFIETAVSKYSMHVSDTLTLSYRLYSSEKIAQVVEMRLVSIPGFRATNVKVSSEIKKVEIDKKTYYMYELQRSVLQPRSIGVASLPGGAVVFEYAVPTGEVKQNLFGNYQVVKRIYKTVSVESVNVNVHNMQAL